MWFGMPKRAGSVSKSYDEFTLSVEFIPRIYAFVVKDGIHFDETKYMDTATEARIRESFTSTLRDATKIIIAQRITSVMGADVIAVLDEGSIVGLGTHEELLAGCEAYQEIYYSQMEKEASAS